MVNATERAKIRDRRKARKKKQQAKTKQKVALLQAAQREARRLWVCADCGQRRSIGTHEREHAARVRCHDCGGPMNHPSDVPDPSKKMRGARKKNC